MHNKSAAPLLVRSGLQRMGLTDDLELLIADGVVVACESGQKKGYQLWLSQISCFCASHVLPAVHHAPL